MNIPEFIYTILLKPKPLKRTANFLIKSMLPETVKIKGATIHLNPTDPVVSGALALNIYEKDEIDFFTHCFKPTMNFIDVGANVGLYTGLALNRKAEHSFVLSIEPDIESIKYLEKTINANIHNNKNVFICPIAASNKIEKTFLFKNSQNKGDNRIYADPILTDGISVYSDTIDNLCKKHCIDKIEFIKADVQGAEFNVFTGANQILSKSSDCIIMTEFWPYGLDRCGSSSYEFLELLKILGFSLFELNNKNLSSIKNFESIIQKCIGRKYINLVGLKGSFNIYK